MGILRFLMSFLKATSTCLLMACGAGLTNPPVSLPVPFSGALDGGGSMVFVENGATSPPSFLVLDPENSTEFPVFLQGGLEVGGMRYDFTVSQPVPTDGIAMSFVAPAMLLFEDGCSLEIEQLFFSEFFSDQPPSIDVVAAQSCAQQNDVEPRVIVGTALGQVSGTNASCPDLLNFQILYLFKHQVAVRPDGTVTLCVSDDCGLVLTPPLPTSLEGT